MCMHVCVCVCVYVTHTPKQVDATTQGTGGGGREREDRKGRKSFSNLGYGGIYVCMYCFAPLGERGLLLRESPPPMQGGNIIMVCMYVCMYICMYVCMYVCMLVCMYV